MEIGGFQKLTLLDYPGRMACLVFTRGCDFRCPFCQNRDLVLPERTAGPVEEGEALAYLKKRAGVLEGVVVTGGEPLLHGDLGDFLKKVRELGYLVKLDTNGSFPARLGALLDAGLLDYAALDVKHLPEKYPLACGVDGEVPARRAAESLALLRGSGVPFELRTTVVKPIHTPEDVAALAARIGGEEPWYLQAYERSGGVIAPEGLSAYSSAEMADILAAARRARPNTFLRGEPEQGE